MLGIDDSEGNAKRVMLFGTALLTTIDILVQEDLFKFKDLEIRNIAPIIGHFLNFVHDMKDLCRANEDGWKIKVLEQADKHGIKPHVIGRANEDGWKIKVLEQADKHGIKPHVIGINNVITELREDEDNTLSDDERGSRKTSRRDGRANAARSYESKPWVGVITLESLEAGVKRSWTHWDWTIEVHLSFQHRDIHTDLADPVNSSKPIPKPKPSKSGQWDRLTERGSVAISMI